MIKRPASGQEFEVILDHVVDGIVVQDAEAQIVYVNPAAAQMLGFESPELALVAGRDRILKNFDLFDEAGRALEVESLPGRLALRGEAEPKRIVRARESDASGGMRWGWVKASPVLAVDGTVEYVVNVFQEITGLKQVELGLAEANQRITHLLEETLKIREG